MNKQKGHKPEEIILLLRECDRGNLSQESFCQQKRISVATLHRWRKKYGMMEVADAKRLKTLEKENSELKKMYADAMLGMKVLQEALQEKIFAPILSLCIFLVSCGDPDNSSAEKEDILTLPDEEEASINREERSKDSLEKKPVKSLEEAVVEGDFEVVRAYIEAGSDLNRAVAENGSTALVMAVTFDHTEISLLLIESGADLEVKIDDGSTVLHAAAFYGRLEIVRALLDKGVNTSARTNDGSTALSLVMMPFDELMPFYKIIEGALAPAGFEIDYDLLKKNRPKIAEMLQESGGDASSNSIKAELVGNAVSLVPLRK